MNRSRAFWVLLLLTPVALLAALALGLRHEPRFYRQADIEPGAYRKELAKACYQNFSGILNQAIDPHGKDWQFSFTKDQLNSFFEERLPDLEGKSLEKLNVYHPRVVFDDDRIRLAFRYGSGFWSTVLSYDLKVWVAQKDTNVLVVEVLGRKAGALPIPTHHILNELSDVGRRHNVEVSWYRNDENRPVAVIRFNTDLPRPRMQLTAIAVHDSQITIKGRPTQLPLAKADQETARSIPPAAD
ncbi:MAG: hypothetical protein K2X38_11980 [Gemmataceae bacterium]|nr:hypothetical protein [Gemmataceae bacterium]